MTVNHEEHIFGSILEADEHMSIPLNEWKWKNHLYNNIRKKKVLWRNVYIKRKSLFSKA